MILAKAPMRVSFFGGGSDIPAHYLKHGGATLSTAIDKYVYVAVGHTPHNHIKVSYMKQELVTDVNDLQNEIVRETLKYFGITSNIEINTWADIPTIGTGLAGSSAFTCALIRALAAYEWQGELTEYEVAQLACKIEIEKCGWNIGKQDQFAVAFGGMNFIEYTQEGSIFVTKLPHYDIANRCVLIPTNISRHSANVLDTIDFKYKSPYINELANVARRVKHDVPNSTDYMKWLKYSWDIKKEMGEGITNPDIDKLVARCEELGAACKLLGAGGGGYLLAMVNDNFDKGYLMSKFKDRVCLEMKTSNDGAKIVYKD